MKPDYCRRCGKRIPDIAERDRLCELLAQGKIWMALHAQVNQAFDLARGRPVNQHFLKKVNTSLESLWNICLPALYGKDCATGSWKGSDLSRDIAELFADLVPRRGKESVGQGPEDDDRDESQVPINKIENLAQKMSTRSKNRVPNTPEVREFLEKYPQFAPPKNEHIVRGYSNEDGYLEFPTPKSYSAPATNPKSIPPWGHDRSAVMTLLTFLQPYSENEDKKKRFQCTYDAISHRWWNEPLPAESPLRSMEDGSIDKLMFDVRKKGDEVLVFEPPPGGPCWLLSRKALQTLDSRIRKHFDLPRKIATALREKRWFVGCLAARVPSPRLVDEQSFIKMVKRSLHTLCPDSAFPDDPYTNSIIIKISHLLLLINLRKIVKISDNSIRSYFLGNPLSRAIFPEDVAFFLSQHPDMELANYDDQIRAQLDGLNSLDL